MNWWIEDKPWIVCRRQCRRTIAGSDPPRSSVLRLHFVCYPFDLDDLSWLSFYFYPLDLDDLSWDCLFLSIWFGWSGLRLSFFIHLIWMIYPEIAFFNFSYIWFGWSVLRLHFLFVIHLIWMICPEMAFLFLSIWFVYQFDLFIHLIGMICPAIAF